MSIQTEIEDAPITPEEHRAIIKLFPLGIIAIDLETTGLSPMVDHIVEIGALKILPDSIEKFQALVRPPTPIPERTIKIHGISNQMVENSPSIQDIFSQFLEFWGELPLVAHNAQFDSGHIIASAFKHQFSLPPVKIYCSCKFSRKVFLEMKNHKLATLIESLNISIDNHHRAFDDALACLRVYAQGIMKAGENKLKIEELNKLSYQYSLTDFSASRDFKLPEKLADLPHFVEEQVDLDLKYRGGSKRNQYRPIRPVGLLPLPKGDVLYAFCYIDKIHKTFLLKKVEEIRKRQKK
jgi:DNA polymerase III subunit epsilon